ncbi:Ig-like domain-containing protein [Anatilimnocola floriformis]|uniref:Ig-like domain-containing protein n=1 Tax=Anatilimnocola floriformis TaxID=2948575 RepID=UPI0020C56688|nr:Ig-like domain-containing protein [Anatilimnocola floriformis]
MTRPLSALWNRVSTVNPFGKSRLRKPQQSASRQRVRRAFLESLEGRAMMAFTPGDVFASTVLPPEALYEVTGGGNFSAAGPFASLGDRTFGQIAWSEDLSTAYVALFDSGAVVAVNSAGGISPFATGLTVPTGLILANDGRLLVSEFNSGEITDITAGGDFTGATPYATGLSGPRNMVQLSDGRILVGEDSNGQVTDLATGGNLSGATPFASGLGTVSDIVQSSSGAIYVSDRFGQKVFNITAGGSFSAATAFATGLAFNGLTFDGTGRFLAAADNVANIYDITAGGNFAAATPFATLPAGTSLDSVLDTVPAGSGTLTATLSGGNLVITDTAATGKDNDLTVSVIGGNITVSDAVEKFSLAPAGWTLSADHKSISILAGSFAGQININSGGGNDTLTVKPAALTNHVNYDGGTNTNTLNLTNIANSAVTVTAVAGTGATGTETTKTIAFSNVAKLVGDGSGSLTGAIAAGATWEIDDAGSSTLATNLKFSGFKNLTGGDGPDTLNVRNNTVVAYTLNGGKGADQINLGSVANKLDSIANITINDSAANGGANLTLNDQGNTTAIDYTLTATTIGRTAGFAATFSGLTSISLNAGSGNNKLTIASLPTLTNVTNPIGFNLSAGTDTLDITGVNPATVDLGAPSADTTGFNGNLTASGRVSAFSGVEVINAKTGTAGDQLTGIGDPSTWTINEAASNTYERNSETARKLTFTGMDVLQGGSQVDTFNVLNNSLTSTYLLNGGNGLDVYNLGAANKLDGITNPISLDGQGNPSTLPINDQGNTGNLNYSLTGATPGFLGSIGRTGIPIKFAGVTDVTLNAGSGNNSVTATGIPVLTGKTTLNLGAGGNDTLAITDAPSGDHVFSYTNANDGSVAVPGGGTIDYTGLDPLSYTTTGGTLTFNLTQNADDVSLTTVGPNVVLSGSTIETTTVSLAGITAITVNGLGGTDQLTLNNNFTQTMALNVENVVYAYAVAPTNLVTSLSSSTISEGGTTTLSGSFADLNVGGNYTLTVNWGDPNSPDPQTFTLGATPLTVAANGINWNPTTRTFSLPHQYVDDNPTGTPSDNYNISVTLTDDDISDILYGISSTANGLYSINTTTGAATLIHTVVGGDPSLIGLAALGGALYATDIFTSSGAAFGSINATSGVFTPINNQGGAANWHSLAANEAANILYTVSLGGSSNPLLAVTPNGAISTIGNTGVQFRGLAYDNEHGVLYGATESNLFRINTTTAAVTLISSLAGEGYLGLEYDPSHQRLLATYFDSLWAIDPQTGAATLIGPNGVGEIDGLALIPGAVSELTSQLTVKVQNVVPALSLGLSSATIQENGSTTLTGTITDPGTLDTFTLNLNWGDPLSPGNAPATFTLGATALTFAENGINWNPATRVLSLPHQYLDDNPSGSSSDPYTITVNVTDDDGGANVPTSTSVTVNNVIPTLALALSSSVISENGSTTLTGTVVDVGTLDTFTLDLNWGDSLSPANTQAFSLGTTALTLAEDGINWNPTTRAFSLPHQYLDDNPSDTSSDPHAITATLSDDDGGSLAEPAMIDVTVNNVDPIAIAQSATTNEHTPITPINVLAGLTDVGTLDTHSAVADGGVSPLGAVYSIAIDGTFTYDPNGSFEYLAAGESTTETLSFTVLDDDGGSSTKTVTVTISGVNDAPTANIDENSTTENAAVTTNVITNDTDPDTTDVLSLVAASVQVTSITRSNEAAPAIMASGLVSMAGNSITFTPGTYFDTLAVGETATVVIAYTVTDENEPGLTSNSTLTITVNGENDAPVATGNSYTIAEDNTLTVNATGVLGNDSDVDYGATLTAILVGDVAHGTLTLNPNGSFSYTPAANYYGPDSFTYKANDGALDSNVVTVSLTVTPVDDFDFGDAPASYGVASHFEGAGFIGGTANSGPLLGSRDFELVSQFSTGADGDDLLQTDDEGGVTFSSTTLVARLNTNITVNASAAGKLDAWIDFNRNNVFDASEKIASGLNVVAGNNSLVVTVPDGAVAGGTYARFRISTAGSTLPTGEALNGEVEDYKLDILSTPAGSAMLINDPTNPEGPKILLINGNENINDAIVVRQTTAPTTVPFNPGAVTVYIAPRIAIGTFPLNSFGSILIFGRSGNDSISIESPINKPSTIYGDAGNDSISGGNGPDVIYPGDGNDSVAGNAGNDVIYGSLGNDSIAGGADFDRFLELAGSVTLTQTSSKVGTSTDTFTQIEQVELTGTPTADIFTLTNVNLIVLLDAGAGSDTLAYTGEGNFVLSDALLKRTQGTTTYNLPLTTIESLRLNGGQANDSFDLTAWTKTLVLAGGGGTDTIIAGNDVNYSLSDTLFIRGALPMIAHSTMENALLTGGASNNTFDISGWTKTATLTGGGGTDKLVVFDNVATTTLTNTLLTHTGRGNVTLASIEAADITDGVGNNTVTATTFTGELKVDGAAGNDTINGGAGPSLLLGGLGNDTLKSGAGRTVLVGGEGLDKLTGNTNGDLLISGKTVYDTNAAALALILAEWASAASYADRVAHLTGTPGGLNGSSRLDGTNVIHDNAVDVLLGGAGDDAFFAKQVAAAGLPKDTYTDKASGEQIF